MKHAKSTKRARRPALPTETATQVMVRFRRRCPLCFGLHGDSAIKQGQIAHLDGNRENSRPDNLAFLCLAHHDSYDSVTSQSRGIGQAEISHYTSELAEYLRTLGGAAWPDAPAPTDTPTRGPSQISEHGVALSVFERRIPLYRVVRQFLYRVVERPGVDLNELLDFASATDEALFLFDDQIATYVREVYASAVNLRSVLQRVEHCRKAGRPIPPELIDKDAELLIWFSGQVERWRQMVAPYLHLSPVGAA